MSHSNLWIRALDNEAWNLLEVIRQKYYQQCSTAGRFLTVTLDSEIIAKIENLQEERDQISRETI